MPIPSPRKEEEEEEFVSNCMADSVMNKEFPRREQRFAVCKSKFKRAKASSLKWEDLSSDRHTSI